MKIALYIEDGLEQIVLTPQTETEKGIIGKLHDESRSLEIKQGEFYSCQGGWVRHRNFYGADRESRDSTMIVLRSKEQTE